MHDEHAEWQAEVHLGPTRKHYADRMSERRDRKAGLRVKPRSATIMRPPRSMRHLIGKADAKLLSETRMGSKRSLTAHTNPHRHPIGTACPACGQQDDTASHMLQCDAIMQGIRVEEAFDALHTSMDGPATALSHTEATHTWGDAPSDTSAHSSGKPPAPPAPAAMCWT